MTDVLDRPPAAPAPASAPASSRRPPRRRGPAQQAAVVGSCAALIVAACLPLLRVLIGTEWLPLVLGAGLLSLAVSVAVRRLGGGPLLAVAAAAAGWALFGGVVFLPDTLRLGVLPTTETAAAARALWRYGFEQVAGQRPPTFAEPGLLLLVVTGVWFIAHVVDALALRLRAPVKAVLAAMVLWVVPLALAPRPDDVVRFAVPFLAAAALLLLAFAGADLARWGQWVAPAPFAGWRSHLRDPLTPVGLTAGAVAITAGVLLATALPGFGELPWYELRRLGGGTTLTSNPIVQIRGNLVDPDNRPLLEVTTAQPLYLRTTSLDIYADEEWTNAGIRGAGVNPSAVPFEQPIADTEPLRAQITVRNLPGGVLVPAPYQPVAVSGDVAEQLAYDQSLSTFTLTRGRTLVRGESYTVDAAVPAPSAEALDAVEARMPGSPLTALPPDVPAEVVELARGIVEAADAQTPFEQALALQEELRGWEYSLDPPQGHGTDAMLSFITTRIGYCEQYAGTMAVMLRTLGIPARVAVGMTPGSVVGVGSQEDAEQGRIVVPDTAEDDGEVRVRTYRVTQANAHAWVEVLFPGYGWIAFEPTPRADDDVLVPSAANLAPDRTLAQERFADAQPEPAATEPAATAPPQLPEPQVPAQPDAAAPPAGGAQDGGSRLGLLLAGLALLAVAGGALVARRRGAGTPHLPPTERAQRARRRLVRTARGLGRGPLAHETTTEWLGRVAAAGTSARVLADGLTRAVYAPSFDAEEASAVEAAARDVDAQLRSDAGRVHGPLAPVRGAVAEVGRALDSRLRPSRGLRRQAGAVPAPSTAAARRGRGGRRGSG